MNSIIRRREAKCSERNSGSTVITSEAIFHRASVHWKTGQPWRQRTHTLFRRKRNKAGCRKSDKFQKKTDARVSVRFVVFVSWKCSFRITPKLEIRNPMISRDPQRPSCLQQSHQPSLQRPLQHPQQHPRACRSNPRHPLQHPQRLPQQHPQPTRTWWRCTP